MFQELHLLHLLKK